MKAQIAGLSALATLACGALIATGSPAQTRWTLPMPVSQLPKSDYEAIMKAAGYTRHAGGWNGWDDFGADYDGPAEGCPAAIDDKQFDGISSIRDLDGDGNPEVITTSSGTFCYGNTGTAFVILTKTPAGWRRLIDATGIPVFYPRKGSAWPDIEIGGPGFCFARARWSGTDYSASGGESYENKPCGRGIFGENGVGSPPTPKKGGLPVPVGSYAVDATCAEAAAANDYLVLSEKYWGEIDGDTPIGPFKALGNGRWSLGSGLIITVTKSDSFIENNRLMTWCKR